MFGHDSKWGSWMFPTVHQGKYCFQQHVESPSMALVMRLAHARCMLPQTGCLVLRSTVLQSLAQVLVVLGEFKHTHTHTQNLMTCQVQSWRHVEECVECRAFFHATFFPHVEARHSQIPPRPATAQSLPVVPLIFVTSKFQGKKVWLAHCGSEQKCKSNWRQRKIDFPDFEWHLIHSHILPIAITDIHHQAKLKVTLH